MTRNGNSTIQSTSPILALKTPQTDLMMELAGAWRERLWVDLCFTGTRVLRGDDLTTGTFGVITRQDG